MIHDGHVRLEWSHACRRARGAGGRCVAEAGATHHDCIDSKVNRWSCVIDRLMQAVRARRADIRPTDDAALQPALVKRWLRMAVRDAEEDPDTEERDPPPAPEGPRGCVRLVDLQRPGRPWETATTRAAWLRRVYVSYCPGTVVLADVAGEVSATGDDAWIAALDRVLGPQDRALLQRVLDRWPP